MRFVEELDYVRQQFAVIVAAAAPLVADRRKNTVLVCILITEALATFDPNLNAKTNAWRRMEVDVWCMMGIYDTYEIKMIGRGKA